MWHRSPAVAGSFYPANPQRLSEEIDSYLGKVDERPLEGGVLALVSPHAGYIYSGPVAAYAYKQLVGSGVDLVVVIAPSHRARFSGASVIPAGIYETPLGGVSADEEIGQKLMGQPHYDFIREVHMGEHSLEVQVPFLQRVLGDFSIVPIIVGTVDLDMCRAIGEELAGAIADEKRKYVIVLSTDLSHYFPYKKACDVDNVFIQTFLKYDENELYKALSSDRAQACGEGPLLCGLVASKKLGGQKAKLLKYANSGDTAGDKDRVVGYCAAAILK